MKPNLSHENRTLNSASTSRSQTSTRDEASEQQRRSLQIRNILVPLDFSAPSLRALEFALPLIKHFGADLHLVHVFATDHPFTGLVGMPFVLPELEISRSIHKQLKDVAQKYSIDLRPDNLHAIERPSLRRDLSPGPRHGHRSNRHRNARQYRCETPCPWKHSRTRRALFLMPSAGHAWCQTGWRGHRLP